MKKTTKIIGAAALAASLLPFSVFAASTAGTKTESAVQSKFVNMVKTEKFGVGKQKVGMFSSLDSLKALGLDETKIKEGFAAGKTLATIASEQDISRDKLIATLKADMTKNLTQDVKDGKLTQVRADDMLKDITTRITDMIDGKLGKMGDMKMKFHSGPLSPEVMKSLGLDETKVKEGLENEKTLATVASEQGVSRDKLIAALKTDMTTHLTQEVKDGKLTQTQADDMLKDVTTRITDMIDGKMKHIKMEFRGGPLSPEVIKSLGLDETKVKDGLKNGKTLAEVAKEQGVSRDKLIAAMKTEITTHLTQAVKDGHMTQAQADDMLKDATTRITDMIDGKMNDVKMRMHGGMGHGARFEKRFESGVQQNTKSDSVKKAVTSTSL